MKKRKKIVLLAIVLLLITIVLTMAMLLRSNDAEKTHKLTFKEAISVDSINKLNGKKVTMTGYMSTLSPLNGKFTYLMNLPYQSCPFCIPNTNILSNTIAIYAKEGSKFEFTDKPITVEGTLRVGNFKDEFEYEYGYRIEDVTMKDADIDKLSKNIKIYSAMSQDGLLEEILSLIMQTSANIYYKEYDIPIDEIEEVSIKSIDGCISKLSAISKNDYSDVIENLRKLKVINEATNENIRNKKYDNNISKQDDIEKIYTFIGEWINKYEM